MEGTLEARKRDRADVLSQEPPFPSYAQVFQRPETPEVSSGLRTEPPSPNLTEGSSQGL